MNSQKVRFSMFHFYKMTKMAATTSRHPKFELKNENCKNLTASLTRKTFNKLFLYYNLDLHIPLSYNCIFHFLITTYSIFLPPYSIFLKPPTLLSYDYIFHSFRATHSIFIEHYLSRTESASLQKMRMTEVFGSVSGWS
jgi:hypothetical protein